MNKRTAGFLAAIGVGAAVAAYRNYSGRRPQVSLRGEVALITGASRGLGLQIARDLGAEGCRVAICARDEEELRNAHADLAGRGISVASFVCDVSRKEEVTELIRKVTTHFADEIGILVNNAGIIQVGSLDSVDLSDFESAMRTMFWGPLYTSLAVLPAMRRRQAGRIVNITSIGGKVSVPHLIPYCCAKSAAVALSDGMGAELRQEGIHVLTVVPGLMRTGSHLGGAVFKSDAAKEFSWFALGASLPGLSISARDASGQIVRAVKRGAPLAILGVPANVLLRAHAAVPEITMPLLELVNRVVLPAAGSGHESVRGYEAEARLDSKLHRALTIWGRRAAADLNQSPAVSQT